MSISPGELALYAAAMVVLTITPGPVWVATMARALAGGFGQTWPLTLGVALGDVAWSVLAILGVSWVASSLGGAMLAFKFVAAGLFAYLGITVLRHASQPVGRDSRLTQPGRWAGFAAGLVVILSNPKAILFYMGLMPGFFDLAAFGRWDIVAVATVSFAIPLSGNLALAMIFGRARGLAASPLAVRRMNIGAGSLLLLVGLVIPFT